MDMNTKAELAYILELLKIEEEEDVRRYKELVLQKPLKERINAGLSWFPNELIRLSIGLGEKIVLELGINRQTKSQSLQTGAVVAVFGMISGQEIGRVNGVLAAIHKNKVKVMLSTDQIPSWLRDTQLGIDLVFDDKTYKEMRKAVELVMNPGKNLRLAALREAMLGNSTPQQRDWYASFHDPEFNPSQNKAIQFALEAEDVALIHGPPGTGKTTTLVRIIQEIVLREHQTLVCAPSNTAVDLLATRCYEKGLKVLRIGNPARVDERLHSLTLEGQIQAHPDYSNLRKLRKDSEQVRNQALKFKRNFGEAERKRRQELLKEARELKDLSHQLEDYIIFHLLQHSEVIVSTLTGAASNILKGKKFHTVCIDEAAQALAPASWIPILRASRVIFAGDHQQLPPTVKSMKAEKGGLGKTLFETIIKRKQVSVMLKQQYRMHEEIMRFSGQQFYENEIVADASVKQELLHSDIPALSFIDTAGCGFDEVKTATDQSTSNPEEAQLLLRHLALLINEISDKVPSLLENELSIGIISPYRGQVRRLKEQVRDSPMLTSHLERIQVHTVDGFQGQERDVIYISLVRSNAKGEIGFLKDIRRMNVALTRAKKRLVVVGDSGTLTKHPFYAAFMAYAEEIGAYQSAWEFMEY